MEIVIDFMMYMFASIKNEEINNSNAPIYKKKAQKALLVVSIILISIIYYIISAKFTKA